MIVCACGVPSFGAQWGCFRFLVVRHRFVGVWVPPVAQILGLVIFELGREVRLVRMSFHEGDVRRGLTQN